MANEPLSPRDIIFEWTDKVPMPNTPQFVRAMAFAAGATAKGVKEIAKPLTHCIPLKDPSCFPKTDNKFESWGLFFILGEGRGGG